MHRVALILSFVAIGCAAIFSAGSLQAQTANTISQISQNNAVDMHDPQMAAAWAKAAPEVEQAIAQGFAKQKRNEQLTAMAQNEPAEFIKYDLAKDLNDGLLKPGDYIQLVKLQENLAHTKSATSKDDEKPASDNFARCLAGLKGGLILVKHERPELDPAYIEGTIGWVEQKANAAIRLSLIPAGPINDIRLCTDYGMEPEQADLFLKILYRAMPAQPLDTVIQCEAAFNRLSPAMDKNIGADKGNKLGQTIGLNIGSASGMIVHLYKGLASTAPDGVMKSGTALAATVDALSEFDRQTTITKWIHACEWLGVPMTAYFATTDIVASK